MSSKPDLPNYDAIVDSYERYAEPATAAFGAVALDMLAARPGERVLDIAAGTGATALPLADAGVDVTAVDLSAAMMARLTARLAGRGRALAMDGQALDFADSSFDAAISVFGIMLFPDFQAGLHEMARVTRPGGRCVVGSWAGLTAPMRVYFEAVDTALPGRAPPFDLPGMTALGTAAGMAAAFEALGLTPDRIETVTLPWTSPPLAGLAEQSDDFFAMVPPGPSLDGTERGRLRDAIRAIAERDRDLPFDSTAVIGLARKA